MSSHKMYAKILSLIIPVIFLSCQTPPRQGQPPEGKPTTEKAVPPAKPALKSVEMPKIGLILGPGAFKTFAHLGVLREFEKVGIKIHAIAGLEWGALIGGIYSMKGRANDLEWQLSKLKKSDLPQDGNFSSNFQADNIKGLSKYLDNTFQQSKIEGGAINFICPSLLLKNGKTAWWDAGQFRPAIEKCMSFPPLYNSNNGWVAAAFDVPEAAKRLREKGAEIIVLVNVLARGSVLKEARVKNQDEAEIIWWDGVNQLNTAQAGIDWIVGVHTRNYDILDFDARQSFVVFGQEFGSAAAKKMAEQYGL